MELIKQRCLTLAAAHYGKTLLAKGFSALRAECRQKRNEIKLPTPMSDETGNTLQRMLKGVISCNSEPVSLGS